MRSEYCERDYDDYEARMEATEARREAMERFCTPTSKVEALRPDEMFWHELLTASASLLEEIAKRDGCCADEQCKRLAELYRQQAAGFHFSSVRPPVKFVRGA